MKFRDGVINIYKPAGWTSQDVCARLRSRLHIRKIGHTGTLDPMATGVLPVCIGKATRIIEFYDMDMKTYHGEMKLGLESDTLDIWGNIEAENGFSNVTEDMIRGCFAEYTGIIAQVPPKYSALRIDGRRAYDLAREGAEFELKAREVTILYNDVTSIDLINGTVEFDVTCSKGTYIRTLCDDIGRRLGCGAVMSALERTESGCFRAEDAVGIEELAAMTDEEIAEHIIPMEETLINLGMAILDDNRVTAFINGNSTSERFYSVIADSEFGGMYRVYRLSGDGREFIGIGEVCGQELVPRKVILTT